MNKSTKGRLLADLAILAIAALVFAALASPKSVTTMAQFKSFPVYRGASRDSVSLQCAVTWEASAIAPMLDILRDQGVHITFAVSGEWADGSSGSSTAMWRDGKKGSFNSSQAMLRSQPGVAGSAVLSPSFGGGMISGFSASIAASTTMPTARIAESWKAKTMSPGCARRRLS